METVFYSCSLLSCMHCVPPSHFSLLEFVSLYISNLQVSLFLIKVSMLITFFTKTLFTWQIIEKEHILFLKTWICVSEKNRIFKLYFPVYTKHNWSCHENQCKHTNMNETLNDFLPLFLHIHENAKILLLFCLLYLTFPQVLSSLPLHVQNFWAVFSIPHFIINTQRILLSENCAVPWVNQTTFLMTGRSSINSCIHDVFYVLYILQPKQIDSEWELFCVSFPLSV